MREHIRAVDLANRIRLARTQMPEFAFVIVEGEDDYKVYSRCLGSHARVEVSYGKPRALEAIGVLDAAEISGVVSILDADLERVLGAPIHRNVILTDLHDLECMLLASTALEAVIGEMSDSARLAAFIRSRGGTPRDHLLTAALPLGRLRLASQLKEWSLKFDGIDFDNFVNSTDLVTDVAALVEEVRRHQGGRSVSPPLAEAMISSIEELARMDYPAWEVCCGHDLVKMLSIGLRKVWGSRNRAEVAPARLESLLRVAYSEECFDKTLLKGLIRDWEGRNAPFRVIGVLGFGSYAN